MANDQSRGEAASYYNNFQAQQPQYSQQQQYGQPQYGYNGPPGPPPGPNYGNANGSGEKPMFDQVFKVERPKWNDLWAGVLVRWTVLRNQSARSRFNIDIIWGSSSSSFLDLSLSPAYQFKATVCYSILFDSTLWRR